MLKNNSEHLDVLDIVFHKFNPMHEFHEDGYIYDKEKNIFCEYWRYDFTNVNKDLLHIEILNDFDNLYQDIFAESFNECMKKDLNGLFEQQCFYKKQMLFKINVFQSNHPLDPIEYDQEIEYICFLNKIIL